ncbi:MAG TPA: class E sortase [Gaiellaceae bacterium]|nr:class E sortase [Gaiellaceae bacterium]
MSPRVRRRAALLLIGLGLAVVLWAGVVVVWGDPFTSVYTWYEQRQLTHELDRNTAAWAGKDRVALLRREQLEQRRARAATARAATLAALARSFGAHLGDGTPIGRIVIPAIGLNMVVVQGTDEGDLEKGPGHYDAASGANTALPGAGGVVAVAGHRTTFLHPFRHIDSIKPGDNVYLEMPYGTFRYEVYFHKVVLPNDWSILRPRPFEKLVLTACHPLYSASHRWVTFARLEGESLKVAFR